MINNHLKEDLNVEKDDDTRTIIIENRWGGVSYISYASLSQIPSVKIETLNNRYKNEMGVIGVFGSTLYVYSASGDSIILDLLIVLVPDGSVYKVYQDLNIVLTSYSLTAINLASLGIPPPA